MTSQRRQHGVFQALLALMLLAWIPLVAQVDGHAGVLAAWAESLNDAVGEEAESPSWDPNEPDDQTARLGAGPFLSFGAQLRAAVDRALWRLGEEGWRPRAHPATGPPAA